MTLQKTIDTIREQAGDVLGRSTQPTTLTLGFQTAQMLDEAGLLVTAHDGSRVYKMNFGQLRIVSSDEPSLIKVE